MSEITSYDQWLTLSREARVALHHTWDAYTHEMFWVPLMAGARLASSCEVRVSDVQVGIYHGGEYVLNITVSEDDRRKCPRALEQCFEGFRVIYLSDDYLPQSIHQHFMLGTWDFTSCLGDFRFVIAEQAGQLKVHCLSLPSEEELEVEHLKVSQLHYLEFGTRSASGCLWHQLGWDSMDKCARHEMYIQSEPISTNRR